jgi:serine/threonine-protein kinase
VAVHEVGREGDTIFIVSDYIQGANLGEWRASRPISPREAAKLCAIIADALHESYKAAVIHRDLKPGNVLIATSFARTRWSRPRWRRTPRTWIF